jgi:ferric iron reductase protein FhuF
VASVAEAARACSLPWLQVDVGAPSALDDVQGTWRRLDDLTDTAALKSQLDVVLAECDGYRDVALAFLAARFAWPLARLAAVPVVIWDRSLLFTPANLWIRRDRRGLFNALRFDAVSLAAPGSAHARAAGQAVKAYRPVVDGLGRLGGLGERALWGQLADAIVATVGAVLGPDGDPVAASEHAGRLLRAADPPLWVLPEFARSEGKLVWRRGSCCLAYRLPRFAMCAGCPLQSRSAWLASAGG